MAESAPRPGAGAEIETPGDPLEKVIDDDSEVGPSSQIQDPLLEKVSIGPDREPDVDDLMKGETRNGVPALGGPPAGRTTLDEARRKGPLGYLQLLGPGLITGASDDDPSGIGTYSQVGSQFGFGMLWMALFTFPMMAAIQELCGRIALHTGVGLGIALRRKFPTWLVGICIVGLFCANTMNLGADLGAVAVGGSMLTGNRVPPAWLLVPIAAGLLYLQFFMTYQLIFKVFKWLTVALFAYIVTGIMAHPNLGQVLYATLVPHIEFSKDFITGMVAVLGTTISPYLFFWQASAEIDEMRAAGMQTESQRRGVKRRELRAAQTDILIGMAFSQLVMYFIILTNAAVLHAHGKTGITSADQAAQALGPFLGPFAFVAFAAGMIGTGLLAIPILSGSAAYAVKEFMGWKGALSTKPQFRPTFYAVIGVATLGGLAMNFLHVNPISALYWSAVINGLLAPPLMVLIALLGSDRAVMADKVSGPLSKVLVWAGTIAMSAAALALLLTTFVIR